jgi:hypothetical protein
MGAQFAQEIAGNDLGLSMRGSLEIHLRHNHFPPVPLGMVQTCIDAIELFRKDGRKSLDTRLGLPEGVSWKGQDTVPVHAVISNFHLDSWLEDDSEGGI